MELIAKDGRVVKTTTNPPPAPGCAATLKPDPKRAEESIEVKDPVGQEGGKEVKSQQGILEQVKQGASDPASGSTSENGDVKPRNAGHNGSTTTNSAVLEVDNDKIPGQEDIDFWQPKPPKVLMNNPRDVPLQMRSQIQMYATTE